MAEKKLTGILLRCFWILFMVVLACIIASSFVVNTSVWIYTITAALFCGIIYWLCQWVKIDVRFLFVAFCICFIVFIVFQLRYATTQFLAPKRGDVEAVYTGVKELMAHGRLTESNTYFLTYPHQRFLLFELYCFNRLLCHLVWMLCSPMSGMLALRLWV